MGSDAKTDLMRRLVGPLVWCWAGLLLAVAFVSAPTAFAALHKAEAGQFVALLFQREAAISLSVTASLMLLFRWGLGPTWGRAQALLLGCLLCTLVGYYGLQYPMAQAKLGQSGWPFLAWHAISMAFFALKTLLVFVLAWQLCAKPS